MARPLLNWTNPQKAIKQNLNVLFATLVDVGSIALPGCFSNALVKQGLGTIAIADVSGKGVPAALIMATFRAALRAQVRNDVELSHIMQSVNRLLCESIGRSAFVTAVYGTLIPESGRFTYTNAGHNPPLLLVNAKPCTRLDCGGPALGVIDTASYDVGVVMLEPGDTLALYTDGVVEVTGREQAEFGIELLERTLRKASDRSAEETLRMVIEQTQAFSGTSIYPDDFTIVIAKRTALTGKR
jgi:sigma-B regulation protein RsbU (phosphoserine phosphatase)